MLLFLLLEQFSPPVWAADMFLGACYPSCAGRILSEHVGLTGKDHLVCPVTKTLSGLGVIHKASGIDFAIFRLPFFSLFTFLTLGAVLLFMSLFYL